MRFLILGFLFMLFLPFSWIDAQEIVQEIVIEEAMIPTPTPTAPNIQVRYFPPEQVFNDDVVVQIVASEKTDIEWGYDEQLRVIAGVGGVFLYPDELRAIFNLFPINDHQLFIADGERDSNGFPRNYLAWTYDIETGALEPFEPLCPLTDEPFWHWGADGWFIVMEDESTILCQPITGQRSPALPADFEYDDDFVVSPDGRYIAVLGRGEMIPMMYQNVYGHLFGYEVGAADAWVGVGQFNVGLTFYFDRWFDSVVTFYSGDTRNSIASMVVYVADVLQVDSVKFAISSTFGARFFDDPPRYIVGYDAPFSGTLCGRKSFDVLSGELTETHVEGLCRPEYGDPEGVSYYREMPTSPSFECCELTGANMADVGLIRYDAVTGERQELYRGELEQIIWVSPDEHYAIVMTDNNGVVDRRPYQNDYMYDPMGMPQIDLVDLERGEVIKSTVAYQEMWEQRGYYHGSLFFGFYPLGDDRFIGLACRTDPAFPCHDAPGDAFLLTFTDGVMEQVELIEAAIKLTPNQTGIFAWMYNLPSADKRPDYQGIRIYDLATGNIKRLTRDLAINEYDYLISDVDETTAILRIESRNRSFNTTEYHLIFDDAGQFSVELRLLEQLSIGQFACVLSAKTTANIWSAPDSDSERVGGVLLGEKLLAVDLVSGWWQLWDGTYINQSVVVPSSGCINVPFDF